MYFGGYVNIFRRNVLHSSSILKMEAAGSVRFKRYQHACISYLAAETNPAAECE
jgi:hypothetical protein